MNDVAHLTAFSDVYFRIGGPHVGTADTSLDVNRDNVLIDHTWVWRADHGKEGAFGWDVSTGHNAGRGRCVQP